MGKKELYQQAKLEVCHLYEKKLQEQQDRIKELSEQIVKLSYENNNLRKENVLLHGKVKAVDSMFSNKNVIKYLRDIGVVDNTKNIE